MFIHIGVFLLKLQDNPDSVIYLGILTVSQKNRASHTKVKKALESSMTLPNKLLIIINNCVHNYIKHCKRSSKIPIIIKPQNKRKWLIPLKYSSFYKATINKNVNVLNLWICTH